MTDLSVQDVPLVDATVHLAASGDEGAFARLVAEHHAAMARVAFVICGDVEATRDALQAARLTAWRRLGRLRNPTQVHAWLHGLSARQV